MKRDEYFAMVESMAPQIGSRGYLSATRGLEETFRVHTARWVTGELQENPMSATAEKLTETLWALFSEAPRLYLSTELQQEYRLEDLDADDPRPLKLLAVAEVGAEVPETIEVLVALWARTGPNSLALHNMLELVCRRAVPRRLPTALEHLLISGKASMAEIMLDTVVGFELACLSQQERAALAYSIQEMFRGQE